MCGAVNTALIALRLDTADSHDKQALEFAIDAACRVATSVQRHRHLVPTLESGSDAIATGWQNIDAIDSAVEVYKALLLATPRKTWAKVLMSKLYEEHAKETPTLTSST